MFSLILLTFVVLVLSGLCSLSEAAILSIPSSRVKALHRAHKKGSSDLLFVKEHLHSAIATIVILNNSINIIGSIFVAQQVTFIFGNRWLGITSAFLTFSIIIIAEILPKTIGEHYKINVSLASAKTLRVLMWMFTPFVALVRMITRPISRKKVQFKITEQEIKTMLGLGKDMGTVEVDEEILINRVFKLNDLQAVQMMKPIDKAYSLSSKATLGQVKDGIINSPYSRIVVYKDELRNIIGVAQQRVLLREIAKDNYESRIEEFISKPVYVPENEKADSLLDKFRSSHQHLFIVRNNQSENIGIITMEDCLEELFGEIYDEKDLMQKQSKGKQAV